MCDTELGIKADGLCVKPYLMHGVPNPQTADGIISDIDEQMIENGAQIEECIKSLLEMTAELAGDSHNFIHPVDALNHMSDNHLLEKMACYDPKPDEITKILKHVLQELEEQPGCEEAVLQHLLQLTSKEAINLPPTTSAKDKVTTSMLSINTASDDSEHTNQALWNNIAMKLRRTFIDKLKKLPVGQPRTAISTTQTKRLAYVQSLCSLYPAEDVWNSYRTMRGHQLDQMLLCCKREGTSGQQTTFIRAVSHFSSLVDKVKVVVEEDFELFNTGIFGSSMSTLPSLQDIYMEPLLEEVSAVVDCLHHELTSAPPPAAHHLSPKPQRSSQRHGSKDSSSKGGGGELKQSSSEFGFMSHLKGNLRRQHSKSLDSLLSDSDKPFSDITSTSTIRHIDTVLQLIESLQQLEQYFNDIYSSLMWEALATPMPIKSKPRTLKSALKGSQVFDQKVKSMFSPKSFEKSGMLPDAIPPPFGATQAMVAQVTDSMRVVEQPVAAASRQWSWQPTFRKLATDLSAAVDTHLKGVTDVALQLLDSALHTGKLAMQRVPRSLVGGIRDYPMAVSKEVYVLLHEVERLLPLALMGSHPPLQPVTGAYLDAVSFAMKNLHLKLSKLGGEISDRTPVSLHYKVLANAAFARNHLMYLEQALSSQAEEQKSSGLPDLYKNLCELVDKVGKGISQYHVNILTTVVLHDSQSNAFTDAHEFYENERCSFCIQMWHLHLSSLREELWSTCPPRLSQAMLLQVLHQSLVVLARRYCHVKPSYRRTEQFKLDISAILLCVSELLLYGCSNSGHYLLPAPTQKEVFGIHNCCGSLLAAMAVVASPIDVLYRVYKKGFKKKQVRREDEDQRGYMSQWLSWVRPSLLPPGVTDLSALQTTAALHLQLQLIQAQAHVSWALLMQSLLMKDYTLSIMLLTKTAALCAGAGAEVEQIANTQVCEEVFTSLTCVMLHCGHAHPAAFTRVLLPVITQTEGWPLFDIKEIPGKTTPVPVWMQAVFTHLDSFIIRAAEPGVRVLLARNEAGAAGQTDQSLLEWMESLPCGCRAPGAGAGAAQEGEGGGSGGSGVSSRDILAEALYSVVAQLTEDVFCLPTPVTMFFQAAQNAASEAEVTVNHDSVGLKLIAAGLRTALLDTGRMESLVGVELDENLVEYLKMLAECTYHVLTASNYGKGSGTPRIAGMFMKANRNWLKEQVDTITEHIGNPMFSLPPDNDGDVLENMTADFLEQQLTMLASSVLASPHGAASLATLHHLIQNNMAWIMSQMEVDPLLPPSGNDNDRPAKLAFTLNTSSKPPPTATTTPLQLFSKIGGSKFDHAAIAGLNWNWAAILQSDLGITEVAFRNLLFNRHEMQEGAYLEETEMKPVQTLRNKFEATDSM